MNIAARPSDSSLLSQYQPGLGHAAGAAGEERAGAETRRRGNYDFDGSAEARGNGGWDQPRQRAEAPRQRPEPRHDRDATTSQRPQSPVAARLAAVYGADALSSLIYQMGGAERSSAKGTYIDLRI